MKSNRLWFYSRGTSNCKTSGADSVFAVFPSFRHVGCCAAHAKLQQQQQPALMSHRLPCEQCARSESGPLGTVVGGGGCASLPELHLRCRASLDSLCRRQLAVPRMEHMAIRLPFSARHWRGASANVLCVFPLSLPLQPHVLRHLLVRCLQKCEKQAPAHSSGRFVRQLRRDGETAPAAAARRLSCACLRCGLPHFCVTRCCADCGVLCVRCGGRADAVSVVEDG